MKKSRYLLTFVSPFMILCIAYAVVGIYPFGDKTLFNGDLQGQYVAFFSYLHEILHGNADVLYTFSKVLGGTTIDMISYYLSSPFNILFYFFDGSCMPLAFFVVSSLKICCVALSMYWFLQHRSSSLSTIVFSTAYALSGWVVSYQFQLMWLDGLIVLPILVYFIEHFEEKNPFYYAVVLGIGIISNYYIGYMLCGICVIYFLVYRLFIAEEKNTWKKECTVWIRFAWYSGLGGMLSAFILIPTLFSLRGAKESSFSLKTILDFRMRFAIFKLPKQMLPFSFSMEQMQDDGLPLIYCGVLTALCCIGFFLSRYKIKKKIGYILVFGILITSMIFQGLYQAWHGFAFPSGFQTRFSFIYIFFVVYLGSIFWTDVVLTRKIWQKRVGKYFQAAIIIVALVECLTNVIHEYSMFTFEKKETYDSTYNSNYVLKQAMDFSEEGMSRVAGEDLNGGWMFNYPSISSYTSCEKLGVLNFINQLGLESNGYWANYCRHKTPELLTALLGVRYFILPADEHVNEHYSKIAQCDSNILYEYDAVMPLGFFVKEGILDVDTGEKNPMVYLEAIWDNILAKQEEEVVRELSLDNRVSFENNRCSIRIPNKDHIVLYLECNRECYIYSGDELYAEINSQNPLVTFSDKNSEYEKEYVIENISMSDVCEMKLYECDMEEVKKRILSQQDNSEPVAKLCMNSYSDITVNLVNTTEDEQYYMLTIPQEQKAWKVKINGQKTEPIYGLDNLVLLKLPKGEYQVSLHYIPRGLYAGIAISVMGIVLLAISLWITKNRNTI